MASRKRIVLCYVLLQASFWGMISSICAYQAAIVLDRGFTTGQAGIFCALCWNRLGANAAMLFGAAAIVVLRLLAAYYHWSLPKSDYHDEPQTTTAAQTNQDSEIPQ